MDGDGSSAGSRLSFCKNGTCGQASDSALEHALAKDQHPTFGRRRTSLAQIEGIGACSALEQALANDPDNRSNLLRTYWDQAALSNLTQMLIATWRTTSVRFGWPLSEIGAAACRHSLARSRVQTCMSDKTRPRRWRHKPLPPDAIAALTAALKDRAPTSAAARQLPPPVGVKRKRLPKPRRK